MSKQKSQPLVSIIVPVYNKEEYLRRCLESIINQTYQNLEIILVDDGSTDGSGEICRRYAGNDPRICLFTQENQGLSAARNVGLDHMKGGYVVFVDADDYISLSLVEILLDQLTKRRTRMAVGGITVISEEEAGQGEVYPCREIECSLLGRDDVYDTVGMPEGSKFVTVWGKLYQKELFRTLRFDIGKINEDEFIYHKIYDQVERLSYVRAPLYYNVMSGNSITRKGGNRRFHPDVVEAFFGRLEYFQAYGKKKYIKVTKDRILWLTMQLCGQSGAGDQKTKEELIRTEKRIRQITGSGTHSFTYYLFCISPAACRLMRTAVQRLQEIRSRASGRSRPGG